MSQLAPDQLEHTGSGAEQVRVQLSDEKVIGEVVFEVVESSVFAGQIDQRDERTLLDFCCLPILDEANELWDVGLLHPRVDCIDRIEMWVLLCFCLSLAEGQAHDDERSEDDESPGDGQSPGCRSRDCEFLYRSRRIELEFDSIGVSHLFFSYQSPLQTAVVIP